MADHPLLESGERGRTVIEDTVLERIATYAALDITGVAATGSDLEKLIGRRLPKARATVAGSRARVQMEVAVAWPQPMATVAGSVRDHVMARLADLTGLAIDAVDVEVSRVVHTPSRSARRVQ